MTNQSTKTPGRIFQIDAAGVRDPLGELIRGSVEETWNARLNAEADELAGGRRFERTDARKTTRSGT